jgi:hypothetical protein
MASTEMAGCDIAGIETVAKDFKGLTCSAQGVRGTGVSSQISRRSFLQYSHYYLLDD